MATRLMNDRRIRELAEQGMITPFEPKQVRKDEDGLRLVSYGLSSYGYDFRIAPEFKVFVAGPNYSIVDPKNFDHRALIDHKGDTCIIPPNSFVLCHTVERFHIPRNVVTICVGKSTYARCGIIINVTPFEPGWEGWATIEVSNTTSLPARIYANEGMGQILFFENDEEPDVSYADKAGKYQDQPAQVVTARL